MTIIDDSFVANGLGPTGFLAKGEERALPFGGRMFGQSIGLLGIVGDLGLNQQNRYSGHAGVEGISNDFTGVAGASLNQTGVYGQVEDRPLVPAGLRAGVLGVASTQPGVIGFSRAGDGIEGASFTSTAVRAVSFFGPGISSISGALNGVTGISGTQGPTPVAGLPTIAGVSGSSADQPGVIGTSNTRIGVLGFSNNVGIFGQTTNNASFAGLFVGNVAVNGTLTANVKNSMVTFPDGTQRVLHCMESPEHWFEDFGTTKLRDGRATVKLDTDFAKVIKRGDYKVFLTPEGDCRGLYVRRRAASFDVREFGGGKSSVTFSYRIVGRRRDIKRHQRFAKIDTRGPMLAAAARAPRQARPTAAALRSFVAGLEREARERAPKGTRKAGRTPPPNRRTRRPARRATKQ